ncbi:MAG: peptidoglycan-binding domain-containing protein [Candidatus Pacebacteria bacterium]|nr:peptidoglycan-binding domain-containing protein [Candidatus Paceibacterota bacterium]
MNGTKGTIMDPNTTIVSGLSRTATSYTWTVTQNTGWGMGMRTLEQKIADFLGFQTVFADTNQYVIGVGATVPGAGEIAWGASSPFTIVTDGNSSPTSCVITRNLTLGSHDQDVITLQNFLRNEGFFSGESYSTYDRVTFAAVKAFQTANGIPSLGNVGPITRARINAIPNCGVTNLPLGCSSTFGFSTTTGLPCGGNSNSVSGCPQGPVGFNYLTGRPCGDTTPTSGIIYDMPVTSPTTGDQWSLSANKNVFWTYPTELAGKTIQLKARLISQAQLSAASLSTSYMPGVVFYSSDVAVTTVDASHSLGAGVPFQFSSSIPDGEYAVLMTAYDPSTGITHVGLSGMFNIGASSVPSIHLAASAPNGVFDGTTGALTIKVGDTVSIGGTLQNLSGVPYGANGHTTSWNFDPVFNSVCQNGSPEPDEKWTLTCTPTTTGTSNVYVNIYKDGAVYQSNIVRVNVIGTNTAQPSITITYPQSGNSLDNSGAKSSGLIGYIQWTSSNTNNLPIEIDLLNNFGVIVNRIATYLSDTGSYPWKYDSTIPNGSYTILVSTQAKEGTPNSAAGRSGYFTLSGNNVSSQSSIDASPQTVSSGGNVYINVSPRPSQPWTLTYSCPLPGAFVTDGGCTEVENWSQYATLPIVVQAVNNTASDQTITAKATFGGWTSKVSFVVKAGIQSTPPQDPPVVSTVASPASNNYEIGSGEKVFVSGSGFVSGDVAIVGSSTIVPYQVTSTGIIFYAPTLSPGSYTFYVNGPTGKSNSVSVTVEGTALSSCKVNADGSVTGTSGANTYTGVNRCANSTTLVQYSCDNNSTINGGVTGTAITCPGSCSNGACVAVSSSNSVPTPSITLTANPTAINYGGATQVSWSAANATSCSKSGGWSQQNIALSGSQQIGGLTATTLYTITCTNSAGVSNSSSVTVIVHPQISMLDANPTDQLASVLEAFGHVLGF